MVYYAPCPYFSDCSWVTMRISLPKPIPQMLSQSEIILASLKPPSLIQALIAPYLLSSISDSRLRLGMLKIRRVVMLCIATTSRSWRFKILPHYPFWNSSRAQSQQSHPRVGWNCDYWIWCLLIYDSGYINRSRGNQGGNRSGGNFCKESGREGAEITTNFWNWIGETISIIFIH